MRISVAVVAALAVTSFAACSVLVDMGGLSSGAPTTLDGATADAAGDTGDATPDSAGPRCASCAPDTRCISSVCVPSTGLTAWWSFEDTGDGVADLSGNGNRGTRQQVKTVPGKAGSGIDLATGSCVLFPDSPSLRLAGSTALTVMAWSKNIGCPDAVGGRRMILNKESTYELAAQCSGSTMRLQEAIFTGAWDWFGTAQLLPDGPWQHVAITWDGTTVRHYVDGVESYTRPLVGAMPGQDTGLGIGCRGVAADGGATLGDGGVPLLREWFAGTLDEVAVYGRALSAAELRAYYEAAR